MVNRNNFAQQAFSTGLAAVTALTAMATPGFPPAAFAGQSPAAKAVTDCMNNNGWAGGATLAAIWNDALSNPERKQTAAFCIAGAYTKLGHPVAVMEFMNKYQEIGRIAHRGPIANNSGQGYGASYNGSAVPGCTLRSAYDPAINQQLRELYDRCVLAGATAETTRAESRALAEQRKYECILNQNEVNALIAQENKRIGRDNLLLDLFKLGTAAGSGIAFGNNNPKLGWPLAAASLAGVLFFPQKQMIQTGNYEQCAAIKRNLAATNGL